MRRRKIGIIGCGTIGTELALAVHTGKIDNAFILSLFDAVQGNAEKLKSRLPRSTAVYSNFDRFIGSDTDIVVEAASQQAVTVFAAPILEAHKDLMIMSAGALADKGFLSKLLRIASDMDSRIYVPTGAIAGVDAIRSVRHMLDAVELRTTKNPKALAGAPFFSERNIEVQGITENTVLYEGPAAEAVKLFPANVNVAAVLSLAGLGAEKTMVRIIADPRAETNRHEIIATGSFGEIRIAVNNVPSPGNPKTSFLAVLSAIECLRSICDEGLRIGT